jgi:large subunit ribosomal protein L4
MKVDVLNMQGQKVATTELPAAIFEAPILEEVMHQALVRQLANGRLGTRKTKTRGEVSGGGKKPWRQKGTGRARQGSIRSPQWRGGGKVHTPMPRDFSLRMPRKMRHAALRSALSIKAAQAEIIVLDQLTMAGPKTKDMAAALTLLVGDASALIILPGPDEVVEKSVRNLPTAKTLRASYINIRDLFGYDRVVMPMGTVDALATALAA